MKTYVFVWLYTIEQVIFSDIYARIQQQLMKKEAMNLKEIKKGYIEDFGKRKKGRNCVIVVLIFLLSFQFYKIYYHSFLYFFLSFEFILVTSYYNLYVSIILSFGVLFKKDFLNQNF